MSHPDKTTDREQRAFVRIATDDPIHYRRLLEDEVEAVARRIAKRDQLARWVGAGGGPTEFQIEVINRLEALEKKLDLILELVSERRSPEDRSGLKPGRLTSLSGSGLSFTARPDPEVGKDDQLEVLVYLPGFPGQPIELLTTVVRAGKPEAENGPEWECAVTYSTIAESDQDQIIAYIFKHQRRALKRRRDKENAQ